MKLLELFISETRIIGNPSPDFEDETILYYKGNVWLLDDVDALNSANEYFNTDYGDMFDFSELSEENPLIIYGTINNGFLQMDGNSYLRHSVASKALQKLIKDLDLRGIEVTYYSTDSAEDATWLHSRHDFLTPLEDKTFYHGTSLSYLKNILKTGILPKPLQSNFSKIYHQNFVFVTLNPERAEFHARTAALKSDSYPVVLSLKIPDIDKLVLDYDVAIDFYGIDHPLTIKLGYSDIYAGFNKPYKGALNDKNIKKYVNRIRKNPYSLNTQLGSFGYKGRIPPKFIKSVLADSENLQAYIFKELYGYEVDIDSIPPLLEWEVFSPPNTLLKYIDRMKEDIEQQFLDDEE